MSSKQFIMFYYSINIQMNSFYTLILFFFSTIPVYGMYIIKMLSNPKIKLLFSVIDYDVQ